MGEISVFGDKALIHIIKCDISENIQEELYFARKYAEGRGILFDIKNNSILPDIEQLIEIKLNN